mgnify:CR=1 FL=1|jgi:hypothetical protein
MAFIVVNFAKKLIIDKGIDLVSEKLVTAPTPVKIALGFVPAIIGFLAGFMIWFIIGIIMSIAGKGFWYGSGWVFVPIILLAYAGTGFGVLKAQRKIKKLQQKNHQGGFDDVGDGVPPIVETDQSTYGIPLLKLD